MPAKAVVACRAVDGRRQGESIADGTRWASFAAGATARLKFTQDLALATWPKRAWRAPKRAPGEVAVANEDVDDVAWRPARGAVAVVNGDATGEDEHRCRIVRVGFYGEGAVVQSG